MKDKKIKKILIISNMYPSKKYPHYGVFVKNAVDILVSGGYHVDVCSIPKCDNKIVRLFFYIYLYVKCIFLGTFGKYDCLYAHFVSRTAIPVRVLKAIHSKMFLVENAHGNDVITQTKNDTGVNIERSRKVLPLADRVIVPSDYFKKVVSKTFCYPEEKIFVSPSGGVDTVMLHPLNMQQARGTCGLESGTFYLGYVGRITAGKGWSTLLDATKIVQERKFINNLKLLIVGSGDQNEMMDSRIRELDLDDIVERRPFVAQRDLAKYYCSMNLFVFPSESESLGLVGLEAMSCGVLCICSNNYGIATYATDNINCLMFEKTNAEQLALKIIQAYEMSQPERDSIINRGLNTAKMYDRNVISMQFIEFFNDLLSNNE